MKGKPSARSWVHLFVVALLSSVSVACNGTADNSNTNGVGVPKLNVSGSIQNWPGGAATLRAVGSNTQNDYTVGQGNVSADGRFTLDLADPPDVPTPHGPFVCQAGATGTLELTPDTHPLEVTLVQSFRVADPANPDGLDLGEIRNLSGDPTGENDSTSAYYVYASAQGTLKGKCVFTGQSAQYDFDLDLKTGWNEVASVFTRTPTGLMTTNRTGTPPEGLKWVYYEFPSPPPPGPASVK